VYHFNKKGSYEIRISLPYAHTFRKGMNFAALRFKIEKNNGIYIGFRPGGSKWSNPTKIHNKTKGIMTAYFPVTPWDKSILYIGFKEGAKIDNLRYTFLSKKEFSGYSDSMGKRANKKIFNMKKTLRKFSTNDELYNLDADIEMVKNLLEVKTHPIKLVVEGKKKIYNLLDYYLKRMKKTIGESRPERDLTEEEKKMLKSLGYL
jgi:hypothetical protein